MRAEFVRWDCGCVGLRFPGEAGAEVALAICDSDADAPNSIAVGPRPGMAEKRWEPLQPEEVRHLLDRVGREAALGHRYRHLQTVLRVAVVSE